MPLTEAQIRALVQSTSVGAVAYQASVLKRDLFRINEHEYPPEAQQVRDVLLCWPEFILDQLWKIHSANPYGATGAIAVRVRGLASVIHALYSYIRYLTASAPRQAPPAVQSAINQLIGLYFPLTNGKPVCVIRPQWEYNLKYVALGLRLRQMIAPAVLDPDMELPTQNPHELPAALWTWRRDRLQPEEQAKTSLEPPRQIAVVSFAGLDTHDSLMYPILAHELGHFIDYSFDPPLNLSHDINTRTQVPFAAVAAILQTKSPALFPQANQVWSSVVNRISVCVRELLADLLAIRMMGFGFLAAQSEFLKTVAPWPDALVNPAGYPGTKFRVWSFLRHLLQPGFSGNIREFLASNPPPQGLDLTPLTQYVDVWESLVKFGADLDTPPTAPDPNTAANAGKALDAIVERAVLNGLDSIVTVARTIIPDAVSARLTMAFHERVLRLERDLPPTAPDENTRCLGEILSAAWAYQLVFGEERELQKEAIEKQFDEYQKTCRLVTKAVELMPTVDTVGTTLLVPPRPELGAVLSHDHIAYRVQLPVTEALHLGIIPLRLDAVEAASIDVHLGNWFVALRRTKLPSVRLGHPADEDLLKMIGREETFVPSDKGYLIHPGDLILGATHEFLAIPPDLMAYIEGKSKWGRLGLIIATASQVAPGFHGVVVLELANAGTVPLELRPGMSIAQIVFHKMSERLSPEKLYRGKFYCQIKP